MLAPGLIAGLFHLAQLRGEAGAFRFGLQPARARSAPDVRRARRRRRQRVGVLLLLIVQSGVRAGELAT